MFFGDSFPTGSGEGFPDCEYYLQLSIGDGSSRPLNQFSCYGR